MMKPIYERIKNIFISLEKKTLVIMKIGLKCSFAILLIGVSTLITYLFFNHNYIIYKYGILIFELSLSFAADFIISGIAVDSIKKQLI